MWIHVGKSGVPYQGALPAKFHPGKAFTRVGVPAISDHGIYTEEQRADMRKQAQRGDAVIQVINHLAATLVSEVGILGGYYDSASPESTY